MSENIRSQCEGCGMCCRAIYLPLSHAELTKQATSMGGGSIPKYTGKHMKDGDWAFTLANFFPITKDEAIQRNPHLKKWEEIDGRLGTNFYACVNLDEGTGRCRIHDNLSNVCSGYPWYGKDPSDEHEFYTDDCFYKKDLIEREMSMNE